MTVKNVIQIWNNNKCQCKSKNPRKNVCEGYIWNPATCGCKNCRYAESIIEDSVIMCDQGIDTTKCILTKTVPGNFNKKIIVCKTKNSIFPFLFY